MYKNLYNTQSYTKRFTVPLKCTCCTTCKESLMQLSNSSSCFCSFLIYCYPKEINKDYTQKFNSSSDSVSSNCINFGIECVTCKPESSIPYNNNNNLLSNSLKTESNFWPVKKFLEYLGLKNCLKEDLKIAVKLYCNTYDYRLNLDTLINELYKFLIQNKITEKLDVSFKYIDFSKGKMINQILLAQNVVTSQTHVVAIEAEEMPENFLDNLLSLNSK